MSTPRRPSLVNHALSTPPYTPDSGTSISTMHTPSKQQIHRPISHLTPPASPRDFRSSQHSTGLAICSPLPGPQTRHGHLDPLSTNMDTTPSLQPSTTSAVLECPFDIEILKDERGRDAYFGTGAWSIVYKATVHPKRRHGSMSPSRHITPPHSPVQTSSALVAVKKPNRRDAAEILRSEAKTLTYLQTLPDSERFVVTFYGLSDVSTLVLGAIPYSLEEHIRKRAYIASQQASNWSSNEPILGSVSAWLTLAQKLVTALAWLHTEAGVVHGDIKPGNILLSQSSSASTFNSENRNGNENEFPYTPILIDFSSSQLLPTSTHPNPPLTPNTLSAVTREYTAPELLSSAVLRDPTSTATPATDVFSLAVTLLVAATGQLLVYPGSVFQRQAMATQGWEVLGLVRNGDGGLRVPRGGVVERVLEGAVKRRPNERIGAGEWMRVVGEVINAGSADLGRL